MSFFLKSYWVYSVEIIIYYCVDDSLLFIDTFPSYIQKSLGDAFFMVLLVFFFINFSFTLSFSYYLLQSFFLFLNLIIIIIYYFNPEYRNISGWGNSILVSKLKISLNTIFFSHFYYIFLVISLDS